jgi:Flp pilus assembly protein TadG
MKPRRGDERGDVMTMTAILVVFLMLSAWALISASQQWAARRDVHAVAAAAARAAAQLDPASVRAGSVTIDPATATSRAQAIITAAGHTGTIDVDGRAVAVTVTGTVDYAFPSAGFPATVTGTASAVAVRGVTGDEGG